MDINLIKLPEIAIIGKAGLCTKERNIVMELWEEANSHFEEVTALAMKEADGSFTGFWGAMSDEAMSFKPWTDNFSRGYYLAGIEVSKDIEAPMGWTKWILPERMYLKVLVESGEYTELFDEVINKIIPDRNLRLSGAVCDYIEPKTSKNYLLYPVENL